MIFGVGVDLVEIKRVDKMWRRYGERFLQRVLSSSEIDRFRHAARPVRFVASCFAAKEALSKAIGTGLRHPVSLREIQVDRDERGKPTLTVGDELRQWMSARGIGQAHLSLTDEAGMACAMVVLERK
jgi:holo-[acyl-carrier protein] synthase